MFSHKLNVFAQISIDPCHFAVKRLKARGPAMIAWLDLAINIPKTPVLGPKSRSVLDHCGGEP
jgi:hypothetical protein